MSGIMNALWRLANPVSGSLCLQRGPRGYRLGHCVLDVGHPGKTHADAKGQTWTRFDPGDEGYDDLLAQIEEDEA